MRLYNSLWIIYLLGMLTKTCFHGLIAHISESSQAVPKSGQAWKARQLCWYIIISNQESLSEIEISLCSYDLINVTKPTLLRSIACEDRGTNCNVIFIFEFLYLCFSLHPFSQLLVCELLLLTCSFDLDWVAQVPVVGSYY